MDAIERKARDEFFRRREEAYMRSVVTRGKRYAWITGMLYVLFLGFLALKAYESSIPQYLISYIGNIDLALDFTSIFTAVWMIICFGWIENVSGDERLIDLPCTYLFFCAFNVAGGVMSVIPGNVSETGKMMLGFGIIRFFLCYMRISAAKKDLAKTIKKAKEQAKPKTIQVAQIVKVCEVCHKESLYDVCLDCEQKYKQERHRIRSQIWRAKQNGVEASLTLAQWLETLDAFHWRCAYCQTGSYDVMEHYIPVTLGGGTEQGNCVPACFSCNSKKSDKHPDLDVDVSKLAMVSANKRTKTQN